jgi:hypothetical protein
MSRLHYIIIIVHALNEEWLQQKNSAAGISSTRNEETNSKHLRKLTAEGGGGGCARARARVCAYKVNEKQASFKSGDPEHCVLGVRKVSKKQTSHSKNTDICSK